MDNLLTKELLNRTRYNVLTRIQSKQKKIFCKLPSRVGVQGYEAAGRAANESKSPSDLPTAHFHHRDYRLPIRNRWQTQWTRINDNVEHDDENNLKRVKQYVRQWDNLSGGGRKAKTRITRLRVSLQANS